MVEIQSSKKYDSFKIICHNRPIRQTHVDAIAKDEDFPKNFKYHPIIVNENLEIIDGQHRFEAAKYLGIPVYYVIQENAQAKDIMKINVNQKPWAPGDFVTFYASQKIEDYEFILKIVQKNRIKPYYILDAASMMSRQTFSLQQADFKNGRLKINNKKDLEVFFDSIMPALFEIKSFHKTNVSHLFTKSYLRAFLRIYLLEKDVYEKLLIKLHLIIKALPIVSNMAEAIECIHNALRIKNKTDSNDQSTQMGFAFKDSERSE